MSAPWPYDDEEPQQEVKGPSWVCPDDDCACNAVQEDAETTPFEVLLRDHLGEVMKGARCRVIVNGRVVNESTPNADGEGWVRIELAHKPRSARVEWAPPDTPKDPIYPYRKTYFADLDEDHPTEAARRRLHNLGFGHYLMLEDNIREFQRELGYPYATGRLSDIEGDLTRYHDDGIVPSPPPRPPSEPPPAQEKA